MRLLGVGLRVLDLRLGCAVLVLGFEYTLNPSLGLGAFSGLGVLMRQIRGLTSGSLGLYATHD